MKATEIQLLHVQVPFASRFSTSGWSYTHKDGLVVVVRAADGRLGYGEGVMDTPNYSPESIQTAHHILKDWLVPRVLGQDLADIDAFWAAVDAKPRVNTHNMAKAALEMAYWDLFAQEAGLPLGRLLGGTAARCPVGISISIQATPADLVRVVERRLQEGVRRFKVKIAPGQDHAYLAAVRAEFPDVLLQADGNSAYELAQAEDLARLDAFGMLLLEQPLDSHDIYHHAKLAARFRERGIRLPVCLDESIHTLKDAADAIEQQACSIVNIKPGRVGGLAAARRIHDLCGRHGLPVWMGGMFELGIGSAACLAVASLPGFSLPGDLSWQGAYLSDDILTEPLRLNAEDSTITVPDGAGLGVQVDHGKLLRYTVALAAFRAA